MEPTKNEISIAIIKPNVAQDKFNISTFITEYVSFIDVTEETFLDTIVNNISQHHKQTANTDFISESLNDIYQMCYIQDDEQKEVNSFASLLTYDNKIIYGTVAILHFTTTNSIQKSFMDTKQIERLYLKRIQHCGVKIETNNTLTHIELGDNIPLIMERHFGWKKENSKCVFSVFGDRGFDFEMYELKNNTDINRIATKLYGCRVVGDVIIFLKAYTDRYTDISISEIRDLAKLCETSTEKLSLTKEELEHTNNVVKNRYYYLKTRLTHYKSQCHYCWKENGKLLTCTGCYRLKYCNRECQLSDWNGNHKTNCVREKQ
jgi:hypothetical protein